MTCDDCAAARENQDYRRFSGTCLYCGARYWQAVGRLRNGEALEKWRQHILDTWGGLGHDRKEIITLGMGTEVPFEPATKGKK